MQRFLTVVLLMISPVVLKAQQGLVWHTPKWVNGVAKRDTAHMFYRLPAEMKSRVSKNVWDLSLFTTGEFLHFRTGARHFEVRYQLSGKHREMPHMPATGVSGVDLFAKDRLGRWNWASPYYSFGDTVVYSYKHLKIDAGAEVDYYLYLPLYNTVSWISIVTDEGVKVEFLRERKEKPIVGYGTSIMHGAVASRPGLSWTNILSRKLDREVINLGFSGNGRFEAPIFDLMATVDAAVYLFDCMPNLTRANPDTVEARIRYGVNKLRTAHPGVPIIFTEYPCGDIPYYMDSSLINDRHNSSQVIAAVYKKLKTEGVTNIWLLTEKEIGFDINSTTEHTHPNDIGMMKYADAYENKIREILREPVGQFTTQQPVAQNDNRYDWMLRHDEIKEQVRKTNPSAVIFANSIIHLWGGAPVTDTFRRNGPKAWERYIQPKKVQNAGFGSDRIENVLWRIYHGELDHFNGKKIIVMIGTNNLAVNSDEEIVAGLQLLLQQIRKRKPEAELTMIGILPRRKREERVRVLNEKIRLMAEAGDYRFVDYSPYFLKGNKANEDLFIGDGLHPDEEGYSILGKQLQQIL
ncbi:SGNH/GDSL hydrolase family protein [uncultured Chitinophaga sp.]|uniref:SGNH/GDSL hydrolase family protein n=1 Tax=uncultured Chitinophaga sp. TaxID=339340 RepID=UPI0025E23401|nr:SGNH/GDSL hydrolase family protein [uncultured Chitinophaga sp.]